jgi:hypothetical protein
MIPSKIPNPFNLLTSWGTSLPGDRKAMPESGIWSGFKVLKHDRLASGEYSTTVFYAGSCFMHDRKLYMTTSGMFTNTITGFFELNTDKEDRMSTCYYRIILS